MATSLYVAAGGGGDAIAAAMLAPLDPANPPCIATFSWDRLIIDPVPGPRAVSDFVGLVTHGPNVHEIVSTTTLHPPARSAIPRLAAELPARFFLLDPTNGAQGMATQLQAIARHAGADRAILVDVGGDLVARGDEPELRSPLADTLALAACHLSGLPFVAHICGPGLDGELSEAQVLQRCRDLSATRRPDLTADKAAQFRPLFDWHPSEVTGLFAAAARGRRGAVEIRDAGRHVALSDCSAEVFQIGGSQLFSASCQPASLVEAPTLMAVEQVMRSVRGCTELDYERIKADNPKYRATARRDKSSFSSAVDFQSYQARKRGADYVSIRRLRELLAIDGYVIIDVSAALHAHDPNRYDPPLWGVRD